MIFPSLELKRRDGGKTSGDKCHGHGGIVTRHHPLQARSKVHWSQEVDAISHLYINFTPHVPLLAQPPPPLTTVEMQYHQYSKLFTSGLLSDPSPAPSVPRPRPRRGRTLFLNSTAPGSPEPVDARTYSFLELADTLTSPVSPADPPIAWHSLGHSSISYVPRLFHPTSSADVVILGLVQCRG